MSQYIQAGFIRTLTGSSGGGPISGVNINIVAGAGISVVGTPGTLTISNTGAEASTFDGDSGSASPIAGLINIFGTVGQNITTSANTNTMNIGISWTTNHAVQLGNATGSLTSSNVGEDGMLLIGANNADPAFALVTSSSGSISITPGANTLDINVAGGGIPWSIVIIPTTMVTNHGYITEGFTQIDLDLPAVSSVGDEIRVVDAGNSGIDSPWRINVAGIQAIFAAGDEVTGAGGYVEVVGGSTSGNFSTICLRCVTANQYWVVESSIADLNFV